MLFCNHQENKDNEISRLTRSVICEAKTGTLSFRNLLLDYQFQCFWKGSVVAKVLIKTAAFERGSKEKLFPSRFIFL